MKFNLIMLLGVLVFASCDKEEKDEIDEQAPTVNEILYDGIDVKGDVFEITVGEKLQITINALDEGMIKNIHVTVNQESSIDGQIGTNPLEYNYTFIIDNFETASQPVLISSLIDDKTDLGTYNISIEVEDNAGNTGTATASFILKAAPAAV